MTIDLAQLNWLAIAAAAVVAFIIGGLWYGLIFGKTWINVHGYTDEQIKAMAKGQGLAFGLIFLADVIGAIVLAIFIDMLDTVSVVNGIVVGLLAWVGFVVVSEAKNNIAHRKSVKAFALDIGYSMVVLIAMGAILGGWR